MSKFYLFLNSLLLACMVPLFIYGIMVIPKIGILCGSFLSIISVLTFVSTWKTLTQREKKKQQNMKNHSLL